MSFADIHAKTEHRARGHKAALSREAAATRLALFGPSSALADLYWRGVLEHYKNG